MAGQPYLAASNCSPGAARRAGNPTCQHPAVPQERLKGWVNTTWQHPTVPQERLGGRVNPTWQHPAVPQERLGGQVNPT
jgi:hypothetical protein